MDVEQIPSTSETPRALQDSTAPTRAVRRRKNKWADLDYLNQESLNVVNICNEVHKIYKSRLSEQSISHSFFRALILILHRCRIPESFEQIKKNPFLSIHLKSFPLCLRETDNLEDLYGNHLWDSFYISGSELNLNPCKIYFASHVLKYSRILFEAVIRRNWAFAGSVIETVQLYASIQFHSRFLFKTLIDSISVYIPHFYLTSLQILLMSNRSMKEIKYGYLRVFDTFKKTLIRQILVVEYNPFFVIHNLIFHIANLDLETAIAFSGHRCEAPLSTWISVLNFYRFCLDLEHLVRDWDEYEQRPEVFDHYQVAFKIFQENPKNGVSLLPGIVFMSISLDAIPALSDCLDGVCLEYPGLILWLYELIVRFRFDAIAFRLFELVSQKQPDVLASADFASNIIQDRLLRIENYANQAEIVRTNLKILFARLDYGRNREDIFAWHLLYLNLSRVQSNLAEYVGSLWAERSSWWRKFHYVKLSPRGTTYREQALKLLETLN